MTFPELAARYAETLPKVLNAPSLSTDDRRTLCWGLNAVQTATDPELLYGFNPAKVAAAIKAHRPNVAKVAHKALARKVGKLMDDTIAVLKGTA